MEPTRQVAVHDPRRTARAAGLLALLGYALLVVMVGCNTPEKRYQVLSFFFDGVPDPNAPPVSEEDEFAASATRVSGVKVYLHKPYKDNKCDACHANGTGQYEDFEKLSAAICLKCHKDEPNKYRIMHGPVAAGECTLCHSPHESAIPALLKEASPAVCIRCHLPELMPRDPPEHQMADKSCLDCHVAHGGEKHGLLRNAVAITAPTSQPTTGSAP